MTMKSYYQISAPALKLAAYGANTKDNLRSYDAAISRKLPKVTLNDSADLVHIYQTLKKTSTILHGTYKEDGKSVARTWAQRAELLEKIKSELATQVDEAYNARKIDALGAQNILRMFEDKVDIKSTYNSYARRNDKLGLVKPVKDYVRAQSNKYISLATQRQQQADQTITEQDAAVTTLEGKLGASTQLVKTTESRAETALRALGNKTAELELYKQDAENRQTQLREQLSAQTAERNKAEVSLQATTGLLQTKAAELQTAQSQVATVTTEKNDLEQRLLAERASTARAQSERDQAFGMRDNITQQYTTLHQANHTLTTEYQAVLAQNQELRAENARLRGPSRTQRLATAINGARQRASQSLSNAYTSARQSQVLRASKYVAGTIVAGAIVYGALFHTTRLKPEYYTSVDLVPKTEAVQTVHETSQPREITRDAHVPQLVTAKKTTDSHSLSLLNLSTSIPGLFDYSWKNLSLASPVAASTTNDAKTTSTVQDMKSEKLSKVNPNLVIDEERLNLSPKAREQLRLLERRLDGTIVVKNGTRASFGNAYYEHNKFKHNSNVAFSGVDLDTARSENPARSFSEQESLEIILQTGQAVVDAGVNVRDYAYHRNHDYAQLNQELLDAKNAQYKVEAQQLFAAENVAAVNAQAVHARLFNGIPLLQKIPVLNAIPLPWKTIGGRTVEVKQK